MQNKTVFFDFDGTLLNSFSLYFQTTKHLHPNITEQEYRDIFKEEDFYKTRLIKNENKQEFFNLIESHLHLFDIFPGVQKGLHDLAQQYNLVIVTACPKHIVRQQLSRFNLPLFHRIYDNKKPGNKAEKISAYCSKHNIKESECYFVADTLGDLLVTKNNQVNRIAVDYGFHDRTTLSQTTTVAIYSSFDKVVQHILSQ